MAALDAKSGLRAWVAGGAAVLASTCCLGAPVLAALGFGGAWATHLEKLEAYKPVFIAAALAGLFFAYRGIFRPGQCTAQGRRGQRVVFWIAAAVVCVGLVLEAVEKKETGFEGKKAVAAEAGETRTATRKPMPEMAFVGLDGKPWKLSDHRGRVVLVNYWATWCPPCRKEMPALARLSNRYKSAGLDVVGINLDESGLEKVRRFVRDYGITYPIAAGGAERSAMASMVKTLPTTFLVDTQGRLAAVFSGAMEEAVFRQDVEKLLAER